MELLGFPTGPYQTNCWIITGGDEAAVIDPGFGAAAAVTGYLESHNLTLTHILLTHGHIDHTRDAGAVQAATGCPVLIGQGDEFMLTDPDGGVSSQSAQLHDVKTMTKVTNPGYLVDGETIDLCGEKFRLLAAPGHTPGCTVIAGEEFAFTGDVLFKGTIGRTDLPGGNYSRMQETLRLLVHTLPDDLKILPGHGPTSTMKAEKQTNQFLVGLNDFN